MAHFRIGADIGGTFTDIVVVDDRDGSVLARKVLTTGDPEQAIFTGLERLGATHPDAVAAAHQFAHATTLVTNVILERRGARTAFLTNDGFRDLIEMGRESRYDIYDLFIRFPVPLVPRARRFGVAGRIAADGREHRPLDEAAVRTAVAAMIDDGIEAVAIGFLHAQRNPAHELRAAAIVAEVAPAMHVSLSHQVYARAGEYERFSTTVADAYVKRTVGSYLFKLRDGLHARGFVPEPAIMLSNGGAATIEAAQAYPIQIVESGPAAGVSAGIYFAGVLELDRVLSFDMGGTTAKLCLIEHGVAERAEMFEVDRIDRFKAGSGIPVGVPVFDLMEIGAGGGSIARVDGLGLLGVGPESASSAPGPACFGLGGTRPTVTDADLLLGFFNVDNPLGGTIALRSADAAGAIRREVAEPLGIDVDTAAAGVFQVVNEKMAAAARAYVAEKGRAASELTLIASGGAGPVHAVALARLIGCPRVVVPPNSSVLSAIGLLTAPMSFERSHAVDELLADADEAMIARQVERLRDDCTALLPAGALRFRLFADMRHFGQQSALEVDVSDLRFDFARWSVAFKARYHELYGKLDDENPVELAALRVSAALDDARPPFAVGIAPPVAHVPAQRRHWDSRGRRFAIGEVRDRASLAAGDRLTGPALVEESGCTTVLGSGDTLAVHPSGCLIVTLANVDASVTAADPVAARLVETVA